MYNFYLDESNISVTYFWFALRHDFLILPESKSHVLVCILVHISSSFFFFPVCIRQCVIWEQLWWYCFKYKGWCFWKENCWKFCLLGEKDWIATHLEGLALFDAQSKDQWSIVWYNNGISNRNILYLMGSLNANNQVWDRSSLGLRTGLKSPLIMNKPFSLTPTNIWLFPLMWMGTIWIISHIKWLQ